MAIPRDCRIANLQRPKRNSMEKKNKNTQEGKCTVQNNKLKRPRRGQSTSLVAAYAHQRPWEECGQSRQRKDAISISGGGKEAAAAASDQVNTIYIRAPCMHEAGGIRRGGESQTSHGWLTKRTRRMARTTIPWDCRIANLQRLKRNSLKKNIKRNTQEGNCTFRSTKLKRSRRGQSEPTPLVAAYAHPDSQRTAHGRSLSLSNEGGGREITQRLYIRVKAKKAPKNKREGIVTYGQSIPDRNVWNAPPSSLLIPLDLTRKILTYQDKMPPPAQPPADGKSMEKAEKPAQKPGRKPKGQPKPPSKEVADQQAAATVGSNAWAKKKKKADQKKARKHRRRQQGPLSPYSIKINGIEKDSPLTLKEWHCIHSDIVRWIAAEIMAADDDSDFTGLNIEEYKFVEYPERDGVKTAQRPDEERKGYGLLLFNNEKSKNMGDRAVKACGLPDSTKESGWSSLTHTLVATDQRSVYTTAVNKYFWVGAGEAGIWPLAQKVLRAKLPSGDPGIELEKALSTDRDKDLTVLVFRANAAWETALDMLKGELWLTIAKIQLKKKRGGEGAAHKVKSRERAAAAEKKAAEIAAEKAAEASFSSANEDDTFMQ